MSIAGGTRKRLKAQKRSGLVEQAQRVMSETRELVKERCSLTAKFGPLYRQTERHLGSTLSAKVDSTATGLFQRERNAAADSFRRRPQ